MPIKVACSCGAAFAARDELAGRTVACPKCKQPLKIPAPQQAPTAVHANAAMFDDIGLKARDATVARCPGCNADLVPNAVLCVKCGFNLKLGRKMTTVSMSGDGGGGGGGHGAHGDVTAMVMAKAARSAEEDAVAEATKTKEGMPAWALAIGLAACIIFALVMSMVQQHTALGGTAVLLIFAGYLLLTYAWIRVVIVAAKMNPLYGVGVFFGDIVIAFTVGFIAAAINWATESDFGDSFTFIRGSVWLLFAFANSDECGPYILFFWISLVMRILGFVLLFIAAMIFAASEKEGGVGAIDFPQPAAHTISGGPAWPQPVAWKPNFCLA